MSERIALWKVMQLGDLSTRSFGDVEYMTTPVVTIHQMPLPQHPLVRVFHDFRIYRVVITTRDGRHICLTEVFHDLGTATKVAVEMS